MGEADKAALEVWKVTVDVQKHFNELGMRVRSIAVTVLAAILAAAGYALKDQPQVMVLERHVSLTGMILLAGLVSWTAFYIMDRLWYHRLLKAAVRHGRVVEDALKESIPTIGLASTIDDASPVLGLRAGHRLTIFYSSFAALLLVASGVSLRASAAFYALGFALIAIILTIEFVSGSKPARPEQAP